MFGRSQLKAGIEGKEKELFYGTRPVNREVVDYSKKDEVVVRYW